MRVGIVVPRFIQNYGDYYQIPLGLAYIASAVKSDGHELFGLNLNHEFGQTKDLVSDFVKKNSLDVIMTGAISSFISNVRDIFSSAKSANPKIISIGGGGVVSSDPLIALDLMKIDYGVFGEGETVIKNLLKCIKDKSDPRNVKGIIFKHENKTQKTLDQPAEMDLSKIAWPDYDILGFEHHFKMQKENDTYFLSSSKIKNPKSIDMITSRSCPYSCTFCFHPVGKVYRERSLDEYFMELDHLLGKYDLTFISILDELFSLRKPRLIEFCKRIKDYKLNWLVQLHVNSADPEILDIMKDSGCAIISYGMESMSPKVLESMQKKAKKPRIDLTLKNTFERNIGLQGNFIFGDTAETIETANETMQWWAENRQYSVHLNRLLVFPGSPDYIMAERDGMIPDRVKYSLELPVNLNISNMNLKNLEHIEFQIWVHNDSLLKLPKKRVNWSKSEIQTKGRNTAWDIDLNCWNCDEENNYKEIILRDKAEQGIFIKLQCKHCRARIDIPNEKSNEPDNSINLETSKELITEDFKIRNTKDLNFKSKANVISSKAKIINNKIKSLISSIYVKIKNKYFQAILPIILNPKLTSKRKLVLILGTIYHILRKVPAKIYRKIFKKNNSITQIQDEKTESRIKEVNQNSTLEEKISYFRKVGWDLRHNPFNYHLHIEFAQSLIFLKEYRAAKLHLDQANEYGDDKIKILAQEKIKDMLNMDDYEQNKDTIFISVSNEEAPYRKSRAEGVKYDRKKEDNFPSYSRADARKSIMNPAARKSIKEQIVFRD